MLWNKGSTRLKKVLGPETDRATKLKRQLQLWLDEVPLAAGFRQVPSTNMKGVVRLARSSTLLVLQCCEFTVYTAEKIDRSPRYFCSYTWAPKGQVS